MSVSLTVCLKMNVCARVCMYVFCVPVSRDMCYSLQGHACGIGAGLIISLGMSRTFSFFALLFFLFSSQCFSPPRCR